DGRPADLAPTAGAAAGEDGVEALEPVDLHDLEELLAGVREVLAEVTDDGPSRLRERRVEELLHERRTPAAAGRGPRAGLDGRHRAQVLLDERVSGRTPAEALAR